uniref:HTH OST-type domain-containing protein n=1 Tax=Steinernema glaseri TaxID=37863 RepID=A0A1I7ZX24_9BILA
MSILDLAHTEDPAEDTKRAHALLAFKVDAMATIAASDTGTLTKMIPLFHDYCGNNPDHTARSLGYPNFEKFLESEYMLDAVERTFEEDGRKIFSLYPDRKIDRLLLITERNAEAVLQRPARNYRSEELSVQKAASEEKAKRFRYTLCKLIRDLGGHSNLIPLQLVQESYFRRYNEPLDKRCWFEHFETRSAQKALHFYFINELSCTIAEETGVIEIMLRRPFADIKKAIINEIKLHHGTDTTDIENEPLEPQPIEQVNLHVLAERERSAVEYFKPSYRASREQPGSKNSEEVPQGVPPSRMGLAQRAMMSSVGKTNAIAARQNA